MNSKHLIALDLDGTLLTDDKTIAEQTRQTVLAAKEAGHIIVIATGRPHRASIQYYEALGLNTPMINFNGALVHHPRNNRWDISHSPLSIETAKKIIDTCYEVNVYNILAEIQDQVYLDQYDEAILDIFRSSLPESFQERDTFRIGSLKEKLDHDPTSMLIHPKAEQLAMLKDELDQHHAELIEHRNWGAPWNIIEIVKKGINKAVGLKKLSQYFGIPREQIIAFGDEDNDLEMIEYAGVGVAMGNGIDELKSIANHVTKTNEQNGIGTFLEEYLQLKIQTT